MAISGDNKEKMILNIFFVLVLQFVLSAALVHKDGPKSCSATVFLDAVNSNIECKFYVQFFNLSCEHYDNNSSLRIIMSSGTLRNHPDYPYSLICESASPINIHVDFTNGKPDRKFIRNIQQERVKTDLNSSYKYRLKLTVLNAISPFAVRYKVFHVEDPKSEVKILLSLDERGDVICPIYSLEKDYSKVITKEIMTLSCLTFRPSYLIYLYKLAGTDRPEAMEVDNQTLSYDPMEGFKINTAQRNAIGDYICSCNKSEDKNPYRPRRIRMNFSLQPFSANASLFVDMSQYSPHHNILDFSDGNKKSILEFQCANSDENISFHIQPFPISKDPSKNVWVPIEKARQNYGSLISGVRRHRTTTEPPIFYAALQMPRTLKNSQMNDSVYNSSQGVAITCFDGDSRSLKFWNLIWNIDKAGGVLIFWGGEFLCGHAYVTASTQVMRNVGCNTFAECRLLSKFLKGEVKSQTSCTKDNSEGVVKNTPYKKGIVQCSVDSSKGLTVRVQRAYFEGFDGQIYFKTAPPINAILKIVNLAAEKELYTKGKFLFYCEAHSFFYEGGLQWFFKYSNGTVHRASSDSCKEDITIENLANPLSNIEIYFADDSIVEIICSAPLMDTAEWHNVSMDISVKNSIPPEISYAEDEKHFYENKHQSISCQANGFPQPEIIWMRNNQTIRDPSIITDVGSKKILQFPNYNYSQSGEYICLASNVAGTVKKQFRVITDIEKGKFDYMTASVTICIVALLISVLISVYLRKEKVRMHRQMNHIIRMLNGKSQNDYGDSMDPIDFPFDTKYDLERNSFVIDKAQLLGRGEFGEVYKGRIDGIDAPVAFKTLAQNASMEKLKSLVSELKIMMYIGEQENLVQLLGAYRKEIKHGILYVAMECCHLGALSSYLQTYKYLFLKCPIIQSYREYSNLARYTNQKAFESSRSYIHSFKTLLKWCGQIASAMEYLGTKNVIHSDLATRNVLLTAEANAKVTDFGLSRRTYRYSEYIKTANKDPLPWRTLAIESLLTNTFSAKSDVWAYGITLWEIFSLGETPYPGMEPTLEFIQELERGLRNIRPKYASPELYNMMTYCWHLEPTDRPSFSSLRIAFEDAVANDKINVDIDVLGNIIVETDGNEPASNEHNNIKKKQTSNEHSNIVKNPASNEYNNIEKKPVSNDYNNIVKKPTSNDYNNIEKKQVPKEYNNID